MSDDVQIFLQRIDDYLTNRDLQAPKSLEESRSAEELTLEDLRELTQDDCFNYAMLLTNYADHVMIETAKQQSVVKYCDFYLNKIVAREYSNIANVYGPYEMKVNMVIQENTVAQKLADFKNVAESRILSLKNKEYNVRKKIDCLLEKGKRR